MTKNPWFSLLALSATLLSGCSSFELSRPQAFLKGSRHHVASRCLCLWQAADEMGDTGKARKGFAGQIYFFAAGNASPVKVDGDVTVFVYENHESGGSLGQPIAEYPFNSEQWNQFLSESEIGPGYALFAPYPRSGVTEANCALRVRLTRPDGSEVLSEVSAIRLTTGKEFRRPSEHRVASLSQEREKRWKLGRDDEESHGQVTTIGVQKDGQFVRVQDKVRRIGNATDQPFAFPDERQVRLDGFERRLTALQQEQERRSGTESSIRQTGYSVPVVSRPVYEQPHRESAAELFGVDE
jgi:hypothetical protein